jgi:hypothetical protein
MASNHQRLVSVLEREGMIIGGRGWSRKGGNTQRQDEGDLIEESI